MSENYEIRALKKDELDIVRGWKAEGGWNPGCHDMKALFKVDSQSFYGGFIDGKLMSSLSSVNYGSEYAFLGLYVVLPEFRSKGYGLRLWKEVLHRNRCDCIGLDSIMDKWRNYETSGFGYVHRHFRYAGVPKFLDKPFVAELSFSPITEVNQELSDYDEKMFGVERKNFLQAWLDQPDSVALVAHSGQEFGRVWSYSPLRKWSSSGATVCSRSESGGGSAL